MSHQFSPEMEKDNKFDSGSAEKAYVHELDDSNYDAEANAIGQRPNEELNRGMKARHIAMISVSREGRSSVDARASPLHHY